MSSFGSPNASSPPSPGSSSWRHLETQFVELQRRYDVLSRRITALQTDLGRELDSERTLVLKERCADLSSEREQVAANIQVLEQQLAATGLASTGSVASTPPQTAPDASLSPAELSSLERLLAESRANLRLIEERMAQYVQETDVPLQLIKDEGRLRQRIAELEARLGSA